MGICVGALSGLFIPTGLDKKKPAVISGAINTIKGILQNTFSKNKKTLGNILKDACIDFIIGLLAGYTAGAGIKGNLRKDYIFTPVYSGVEKCTTSYSLSSHNIKEIAKGLWMYLVGCLVSNVLDRLK